MDPLRATIEEFAFAGGLPSFGLAEGGEVTNGLGDARCRSIPSVWCRYANMRRGRFRACLSLVRK